ncbi:MAG TPA: ATP-binding protein [Ktedonobacterales bacterium]|nr:ATP-binding protein [Ktedonobacterales bacterium]
MNEHLLQSALALAAIALSVFSLITYLWLGVTTLLMSERRSLVTWVGGLGLLFGALFFLCHGALVAAGVSQAAPATTDLWWRLSWAPAFAAPLLWAAIGLRYTAVAGSWGRLRTPALVVVVGLGACTALLALLSWPSIGKYSDFIAILDNSLRLQTSDALRVSPWVPALGIAFVIYVAACASLPWAALAVRRFGPSIGARLAPRGFGLPVSMQRSGAQQASAAATLADAPSTPSEAESPLRAADSAEAGLLWTPSDAWDRARPALFAASLCMLAAGGVVAVVGLLTALVEHRTAASAVSQTLPAVTVAPQPGHAALALVLADLVVQVALACLGLLVGWAVVRQGVLVERRLPQRGYLSHWRGMAALAGALALVVAWMGAVEPDALPDLLLLVALVAVAIALLTWQSYVAHDRLLAQLRPFMASLSLGNAGWLATNPGEVERGVDQLFTSLCRDVLGAAHGRLDISAGRLRHSYSYAASEDERAGGATPGDALEKRDWSLQMSDGRGAVAIMRLGPRLDGVGYTSSDLEIARACGLRILDAVGEFATAQAVASLARRRGLEAELTAALPRRVLHDDVLPRLHLAMLRLEAQRARLRAHPVAAVTASAATTAPTAEPAEADVAREVDDVGAEMGEVVAELGRAHRDLAALMRAAPMASARRLEHGFTGALRGALDGEFRGAFDELEWETPDDAVAAADALPPVVADLLLSATLEAVRNAGRHARGENLHRRLALRVRLAADAQMVTAQVSDNGVGLTSPMASSFAAPIAGATSSGAQPATPSPLGAAGARSGLLTHGALMALVGGSLSVRSGEDGGAVVTIRAPRSSDLGGALGESAP